MRISSELKNSGFFQVSSGALQEMDLSDREVPQQDVCPGRAESFTFFGQWEPTLFVVDKFV